jgi:CheY-like chemotaxis protein
MRISKTLKDSPAVYSDTLSDASTMDESKTSIMVVDDDRDILTVASKGLEIAGYQVHGFSDPVRALQHVEGGCDDCQILISDIRMPEMSGFQLVRRVKDLRPDIKIVLMTAFEVNKTEFEAVFPSTPVDKVMRKPFAISQLAEAIKEIHRSDSAKEQ